MAELAARVDALQDRLLGLDQEAESVRDHYILARLELWNLERSWSERVGGIALAPWRLWRFLAEKAKSGAMRDDPPPSYIKTPFLWARAGGALPPTLPDPANASDSEREEYFAAMLAWQAGDLELRVEALAGQIKRAKEMTVEAKAGIKAIKASPTYRLGKVLVSPGSLFKKAVAAEENEAAKVESELRKPHGSLAKEREEAQSRREEFAERAAALEGAPSLGVVALPDPPSMESPALGGAAVASAKNQLLAPLDLVEAEDGSAVAWNAAAGKSAGEFLLFVESSARLAPWAVLAFREAAASREDADIVYCDEDRADANGDFSEACHKPGWSPELMLNGNYVGRGFAIRKTLFRETGGFRDGFAGAAAFDLLLRASEKARSIVRVPDLLIHSAHSPGVAARDAEEFSGNTRALVGAFERRGWKAQSLPSPLLPRTVRAKFALEPNQKIAIVIPTKDRADLLRPLFASIRAKAGACAREIIVLCSNCQEQATYDFLEAEAAKPGESIRWLKIDAPFNFSRLNNVAVRDSDATHFLFLNNDVEALSDGWLDAMLEQAQRPEIGAVGARLHYPSGKIQHAGVIAGLMGIAGHAYAHFPADTGAHFGHDKLVRNYSACTAACLLVRRDAFEKVGGYNEALAVAFNDVDLCFKIREAGFRIVYTPFAELTHKESESRGDDMSPAHERRFHSEIAYMLARWGDLMADDPYYSPRLSLWKMDYSRRAEADDLKTRSFRSRFRVSDKFTVEARRQPEGASEAERALAILPQWMSAFHVGDRETPTTSRVWTDRDPAIAETVERLELRGKRALELTAYEGARSKQLAEAGVAVVAIEPNAELFLRLCVAKAAFRLDALRPIFGSAEKVLAGDALSGEPPFDVCWAAGALQNVEDPARLLDLLAPRVKRLIIRDYPSEPDDALGMIEKRDDQGRVYRGKFRLRGHDAPLLGPTVFTLGDVALLRALNDRGWRVERLEGEWETRSVHATSFDAVRD